MSVVAREGILRLWLLRNVNLIVGFWGRLNFLGGWQEREREKLDVLVVAGEGYILLAEAGDVKA